MDVGKRTVYKSKKKTERHMQRLRHMENKSLLPSKKYRGRRFSERRGRRTRTRCMGCWMEEMSRGTLRKARCQSTTKCKSTCVRAAIWDLFMALCRQDVAQEPSVLTMLEWCKRYETTNHAYGPKCVSAHSTENNPKEIKPTSETNRSRQ